MDWTSTATSKVSACVAVVLIAIRAGLVAPSFAASGESRAASAISVEGAPESGASARPPGPTVELTAKQQLFIKTARATKRQFVITRTAVGSVDYDEDAQIQVFTPYQGRILAVFVKLEDRVTVGQPLFTIDSADLMQAEATFVQAAGTLDLTNRALTRAHRLVPAGGAAQKDLDQAVSDQQTAEGNFNSARAALHIFGKDDAEIDRIAVDHRVDGVLVVKSPLDGIVTARNGGPGLFVQAGAAPAPLTVADISRKWIVANYTEADSSVLRRGQQISARVSALPDRAFQGRISAIGETIDPATRRFIARAEIADPDNLLRPGMFATITATAGDTIEAVAIPLSGVVREGDGTMTAWVSEDGRRFTQRAVKLGLQQDGFDQVKHGIEAGETVVTDGAVFLNNILEAGPSD